MYNLYQVTIIKVLDYGDMITPPDPRLGSRELMPCSESRAVPRASIVSFPIGPMESCWELSRCKPVVLL